MRFLFFIFFLIPFFAKAQPPCSGPGRTPETAFVVCALTSQPTPQPPAPACTGVVLPTGGVCAGFPVNSSNSVWYRFNCYQSGTLGFVINPVPGDDFDWALFNVTGRPATDVYTNNLMVSLNLSSQTGQTGCTAAGTVDINCTGAVTRFNRLLPVVAGGEYLLLVINSGNSGNPYSINFTGGTAVLDNNALPVVSNVTTVGCNTGLIKVTFSEGILCTSLTLPPTPATTEFTITNGTHVITGITSNCTAGSNSITELTLALQTPLPAGNYNLIVNNGGDVNTLLDVCGNQMLAGVSVPFTINAQVAPVVTSVTRSGCSPNTLKVAFNKLLTCSSIDPARFSVTPGSNPITSLQTVCSGTVTSTDTVLIVLQNPIAAGNYFLNILPDVVFGNNLTDVCNLQVAVNIPTPFTIAPLPLAPIAPSLSYCLGSTAVPLTATGSNLLWYTVPTGGIGTSVAPTPSTAAPSTFYVSQTVGGCESPRTAVLVNIDPVPGDPGITTPVTYCQGATATQLAATGTGILWFANATGGVGSPIAPIPSTATVGSTNYYVSQTLGNCVGNRIPLTVVVNPPAALPTVTSPVSYCQNATAVPLTATGTNLLWYTTATGGVGTATAPTPITTTIGSTNYYVSQTTNNCVGPRALIVVNVGTTPLAPTVTSPIAYCQNALSTALTATGSNLLWYTTATGGTGTAIAPIPSTAVVGSTTYYVSQSTGTCEGPRVAIVVNVNSTPAAPVVGPTINYCVGQTATALTATGTNLLWYTVATGGVGSATAPTPSTAIAGSTNYYVSQTLGLCESNRTQLTVIVNPLATAPTVISPVSYCQNTTAVPLTATGTVLLWYTTATGGVGTSTAPTPSTTTIGSTNYYVSQTTNNCEGPRALIVVNVAATLPAPNVTTPITYCQNAASTALTAVGSNLLWYSAATGGTGSAVAPIPSTATVGSTTFYVSQTTGTCEGPRAAIVVNVNATPAAPVVGPTINYCVGQTATALTATGINLLWYTVPTGGVGSATAPTPSTATASSVTYYVSSSTGTCEGPRSSILVIVTAIPTAPTLTTTTYLYCQGFAAPALSTAGAGTANLLWYTAATGGIGNASVPIPSTTSVGATTYYVSQIVGTCEGPILPIVVTVATTPGAPTVTTPIAYCENAPTNPLTATGTNLLWYTTATGGVGSNIAPIISSATAGTTTYYVSQSVGLCEGPRAAIVVDIVAYPAAPLVTPKIYCPNDVAVPVTAVGTNLLWYTTATGGVGTSVAPTPNTVLFPATYNYYVSQSTGACEGPRALLVITVDNPLAVNIGIDTTICEGDSVKFSPIVTPAGAGYEWRAIGVPLSTIQNRFVLDATVRPVDNADYILKATLGGCTREDTVTVNVRWKPMVDVGLPQAICLKDSALLVGVVTHTTGPISTYRWTPTDSLRTDTLIQTWAYPTKTTNYKLTVATTLADYGCVFTAYDSVKLIVQPIVRAFAGNDTIAVKGAPHKLLGSGGVNYTWSSPTALLINPFSQYPTTILTNEANFYVEVKDAIGCVGYDTVFVKVYNGPTYYVPNTFTPNGDGLNDIFRAIPVGMANTTYFRIFNRSGLLVFETNQYLKGWDGTYNGKPQPNGVYVWMVGGTNKDNKKIELKGTVNIIR